MPALPSEIRGIIFDLDGTLYVNEKFAALIQDAARIYIAGLRGISVQQAETLMADTRRRLFEECGILPTLSAVCCDAGGSIQELHRFFEETLAPEAFLARDERVIHLLDRLSGRYALHIYTNNNRPLTERIIRQLGIGSYFRSIRTIDDTWIGKPDEDMLVRVLAEAGLEPAEALFVGDRYDIDLRIPEQRGCPVYLSQSIEQLLRLEELLTGS